MDSSQHDLEEDLLLNLIGILGHILKFESKYFKRRAAFILLALYKRPEYYMFGHEIRAYNGTYSDGFTFDTEAEA